MALKTGNLTTVQRVKDRMDKTTSDQDTLLERIINEVTSYIESRTGRDAHTFKQQAVTKEEYNGSHITGGHRNFLFLKSAPVDRGDITLFEYDNGTNKNPNWTEFLENDYDVVKPDRGVIRVDGGLPRGRRNVRITYEGGYLIDFDNTTDNTKHTLPHELTALCERLVVKFYKRRDFDGRTEISLDNTSATFTKYLDELDEQVIANYQLAYAKR